MAKPGFVEENNGEWTERKGNAWTIFIPHMPIAEAGENPMQIHTTHTTPYFLHFCFPKNCATLAAVALCTGNVGCSSLSQRYSFTAYGQLGSLVYHVGVPLGMVS